LFDLSKNIPTVRMARKLKFFACFCASYFGFVLAKIDDCKAGQSCTFMSRADGWEIYKELPSYVLTYPPKSESWKDPKTTLYLTMSSYRFYIYFLQITSMTPHLQKQR
jgi:hypothetical protein